MYEDTPKPAENKELIGLYELLIALINALNSSVIKQTLRDGSGEKFNGYVNELVQLTGDKRINDFSVTIKTFVHERGCLGEEYTRCLYGVVNYLFNTNETIGYYCSGPPTNRLDGIVDSSAIITNQFTAEQSNKQNTSVHVEFNQTIISLTEKLTNLERDFPDPASKENQFAKKLKKILPTVSDGLGIIAAVLTIASEVGLSPADAIKFLGLG